MCFQRPPFGLIWILRKTVHPNKTSVYTWGGSFGLFCFAKCNVSVICFGGIISNQNKESGSPN